MGIRRGLPDREGHCDPVVRAFASRRQTPGDRELDFVAALSGRGPDLPIKPSFCLRYPEATFQLSRSPENPETMLLKPIVDVEDRDEAMDVVIDRLGELQSERELLLFVVPIRPPARRQAIRRVLREGPPSWRTGHPALQP